MGHLLDGRILRAAQLISWAASPARRCPISAQHNLPRIGRMPFPATRMRRLRRTPALRALVQETSLSPAHLIQPAFVVAGEGVREEVDSMPGVERFSISELVAEATEIANLGLGAILLFGIPSAKDE